MSGFGIEGIADPHAIWRYTLMSGVIPAIPLILIRPFLPESPIWQQKKAAGTLKRPSIAALFAPELRRTTIVTTLMFAMSYGAAFGAIQQIPQMVPGLPEVREMVQGVPPPQARVDRAACRVGRDQGPGGRGPGRARPPRLAGDRHRQPPPLDPVVPGPRTHHHADRVRR